MAIWTGRKLTGYEGVENSDSLHDTEPTYVVRDIPWKASFTWDEEGSCSKWTLGRILCRSA